MVNNGLLVVIRHLALTRRQEPGAQLGAGIAGIQHAAEILFVTDTTGTHQRHIQVREIRQHLFG